MKKPPESSDGSFEHKDAGGRGGDVGAGAAFDDMPQPDSHGYFYATPTPKWASSVLESMVEPIVPKGVDRAIGRYKMSMPDGIYVDAKLEGNTFTRPEVRTLLGGRHVAGHTLGEELMIADMAVTSKRLIELCSQGPVNISQALCDDIYSVIARNATVRSHLMRADWIKNSGPLVALGSGYTFAAHDRVGLREIFDSGVGAINKIAHPVLRGATWASFATYHQFYWDANKRSSRYVMNAVLLSHGFDAILIGKEYANAYVDAVVASFKTGDLTKQIGFLLSQYDDA